MSTLTGMNQSLASCELGTRPVPIPRGKRRSYGRKHEMRETTKLRREIFKLRSALKEIALIDNKDDGPDWEEIEEARRIASKALIQE